MTVENMDDKKEDSTEKKKDSVAPAPAAPASTGGEMNYREGWLTEKHETVFRWEKWHSRLRG